MAKKYLTLEEAADLIGVSPEALRRAREQGEVRGFADRGNWKFRQEDVEEYGRTREADSDPDLPLIDDSNILSGDSSRLLGGSNVLGGSVLDDEEAISEQPTVIRGGGSGVLDEDSNILDDDPLEGTSDSGVRLMLDSSLMEDDSSDDGEASLISDDSDASGEIALSFGDSANELKLSDSNASDDSSAEVSGSNTKIPLSFGDSSNELGLALDDDDGSSELLGSSDSDVRLHTAGGDSDLLNSSSDALRVGQDSDSDVRLLGETTPMNLGSQGLDPLSIKTDSDSDVKLTGQDSDVRLLQDSDSDVRLLAADSDSDVSLAGTVEMRLDDDDDDSMNDAAIELGGDSGLSLDMDSGISLDIAQDSGIALDAADDSGIALDVGTDSDISLAADDDFEDESLTLDTSADSGISLDMPADSGISLDSDELGATSPSLPIPDSMTSQADGSTADTMVQMPAFAVDDDDDDSESDFELGALEGDSSSDTSVLLFDDEDDADDRAATVVKKNARTDAEDTFDLDAGEVFDEDEFEDDLMGEDDEIEDFADDEEFMADDDDFDESFGDGDDAAPKFAAQAGGVTVMAVEQEWGAAVFVPVLLGTIAMTLCAGVMFDLVRYMWQAGEYGVIAGPLVQIFAGN